MEIHLLTVEVAPAGYQISQVFTLIQYTKRVSMTDAGARAAECQEALNVLSQSVPEGANAVIGVRVTSTAVAAGEGIYLYLTYTGTPARIEPISAG